MYKINPLENFQRRMQWEFSKERREREREREIHVKEQQTV